MDRKRSARRLLRYDRCAAELAAMAGPTLGKQGLPSGLDAATVVAPDQALRLLSGWRDRPELQQVRTMLGAQGTLAVSIPGHFVYVAPVQASWDDEALGFVVGEDPEPEGRCVHFHEEGSPRCRCSHSFQSGPCPGTNTGACTSCAQGDAWSPERPWVDPVPKNFQRARELMGEDARFSCATKGGALKPGDQLLGQCPRR